MKKLTKIGVSALAGSLVAASAQAGELSASGTWELTYKSDDKVAVGNPFGLENSLKLFLDIENFAKEIESVTNINVEQTDPADDTLKEIKDKLIEVIKEND